ncbi:MAG TPA: MBL fold metallo-hydrolase [Gemmatimonadota bacterium]|nr:MBL fold metallo-hydrolase [Gemmatimonadota bacterium]
MRDETEEPPSGMLTIRRHPVGPYQANAWLASDEARREAFLVDAGAEADRLLAELASRDLQLVAILQTHAHADHIGALPEIVAETGAPVYLHPDAEPMLHSAEANLSAMAGIPVTAAVPYVPVRDGDRLEIMGREVRVYHTPGHADGSVCFHLPNESVVFTGDALFQGSIGRTDFPGGSLETLLGGIRDKLLVLPDDTRVLAGHMGPTTIGRERRTNPFLQESGRGWEAR